MAKSCCQEVPLHLFRAKFSWEPETIGLDQYGDEYVAMYAPPIRGTERQVRIVKTIPNPRYVSKQVRSVRPSKPKPRAIPAHLGVPAKRRTTSQLK